MMANFFHQTFKFSSFFTQKVWFSFCSFDVADFTIPSKRNSLPIFYRDISKYSPISNNLSNVDMCSKELVKLSGPRVSNFSGFVYWLFAEHILDSGWCCSISQRIIQGPYLTIHSAHQPWAQRIQFSSLPFPMKLGSSTYAICTGQSHQ